MPLSMMPFGSVPPFLHRGFPFLHLDFLISTAIIVICFVIYAQTSAFYRLTKHEGIRYFRYAFLFFGISFFAQWLFPVARFATLTPHISMILVSMYAGTVAVLALLFSVLREQLQDLHQPFLMMNILAALVAVLALLIQYPFIVLLVQMVVFSVALVYSYRASRKRASRTVQLHLLYVLLFFSWLANAAANIAMRESILLAVILNAVSLALFIAILRKVLRATHTP